MLKKLMFSVMAIFTIIKCASVTFILSTDVSHLPLPVYIASGLVVLYGLFLVCKMILGTIYKKDLNAYFAVASLLVIFNLVVMKVMSRTELTFVDLLAIGTVMDILVSVGMIIFSVKEDHYIRLHVKANSKI